MNIKVKYIADDNFLSKEDVFEVIEIKEFPFNNKCYKLKGLKHYHNINNFIVLAKKDKTAFVVLKNGKPTEFRFTKAGAESYAKKLRNE